LKGGEILVFKTLIGITLFLIPAYSLGKNKCRKTIILRVDDRFTKKQQKIIHKATRIWYKLSKRQICFTIEETTIGRHEKTNWRYDGFSTIYSGKYRWQREVASKEGCARKNEEKCMAITLMGRPNGIGGDIFIVETRKFYALITHEIGHILGLSHSPNGADLMYKFISHGKIKPTAHDRNAVECLLRNDKVAVWNNNCVYEKE
jgi:hypothetical protein